MWIKMLYLGVMYVSVRLIWDVLNFCEKEQKEGILFGADFSDAFDSVFFLFSVLKKFLFDPCWFQILHTRAAF